MPPKSFASALSAALNPPRIDTYAVLGYQPACVPYIAGEIPEPCGQCPQELFASATEHSVLFGGASGGGKTLSALCWALRACVEHPGIRIGHSGGHIRSYANRCSPNSPTSASPKR